MNESALKLIIEAMNSHADFEYEVIEDVIVIYDLDKGNRSVTNDVPYVLNTIARDVPDITKKRVIYRDSRGIFDELVINSAGQFMDFKTINASTVAQALEKLKRAHYVQ